MRKRLRALLSPLHVFKMCSFMYKPLSMNVKYLAIFVILDLYLSFFHGHQGQNNSWTMPFLSRTFKKPFVHFLDLNWTSSTYQPITEMGVSLPHLLYSSHPTVVCLRIHLEGLDLKKTHKVTCSGG